MFLVFLSRRHQHAFCLVGFSAIRFLQHHPEISFRLCCKSLHILYMLSLAVLRLPSSANKSYCPDGRVRHIGRSLTNCRTKEGLGSTLEALRLLYMLLGSMCHLQVRIVDDPVGKIVKKLYLPCLSFTGIVS